GVATEPRAQPLPVGRCRVRLVFLRTTCLLALTGCTLVRAESPVGELMAATGGGIGQELSVPVHLKDGEGHQRSLRDLISFGEKLFSANWTSQEGQGRPLTKGTGAPLSKSSDPLVFPRNFNRLSGPDANSCRGCHNAPFGMAGGSGDIVTNVFVLGQRFD